MFREVKNLTRGNAFAVKVLIDFYRPSHVSGVFSYRSFPPFNSPTEPLCNKVAKQRLLNRFRYRFHLALGAAIQQEYQKW